LNIFQPLRMPRPGSQDLRTSISSDEVSEDSAWWVLVSAVKLLLLHRLTWWRSSVIKTPTCGLSQFFPNSSAPKEMSSGIWN